ncbi:MAG TPA: hypothetical protein VGU46_00390 [Acidobacteriaceae bacterium]|nr:hypothetical protein [Acidobacteriaceae bacterium]
MARAAAASATPFNPFDALGVPARIMTDAEISSARRRAAIHLSRATAAATAPAFPTLADVNAARDYLMTADGHTHATARLWSLAPRTFFAEREFGAANVFVARGSGSATATAPTTPHRPRAAQPTTGQSATDPFVLSDSEEDEEDEFMPPPSRRPRATASAFGSSPTPGAMAATTLAGFGSSPAAAAAAAATPTSSAPATPSSNRSAGGTYRNARVDMIAPGASVIVGTWRHSPNPATPNAVTAAFDRRGRLNYRVTNRDLNGDLAPAATATATSAPHINFVAPYAGLSANEIRDMLDRQLNLRGLTQ